MKKVSLNVFPGDWRRDPKIRQLSAAARGVWWEVMMIAVEGEPYGSLRIAGRNLGPEDIHRQTGIPVREVRRAWQELLDHQIPVVWESPAQFLQEIRRKELYWLWPNRDGEQPCPDQLDLGLSKSCGNPAEKLRKSCGRPSFSLAVDRQVSVVFADTSPPLSLSSRLVSCWFVGRMVRDDDTNRKRRQGGHLGGNPSLKEDD